MNQDTQVERQGPRIFISYSFKDAAMAQDLHQTLAARGHQVQREDDRSLMDQQLSRAIRSAIAEAEVLVQLLTPNTLGSAWVDQELQMALDLRDQGRELSVLPVVIGGLAPSPVVADFWHLTVPGDRLDDGHKDEIHRFALRALFAVPLDPADPFRLDETALSAMLDRIGSRDRRVLIDPEGRITGWLQDTLDYCAARESPAFEGLLQQERRYAEHLSRRLAQAECVLKTLARHTVRLVGAYAGPESRRPLELKILQAYAEVVLGNLVLRAASVAPPAPHELRTTFASRIEAAAARWPDERGMRSTYLQELYYRPIFTESLLDETFVSGAVRMLPMEMSGPSARLVKVLVPDLMFGSMKEIYGRSAVSFDPRGEILDGHFLKILLWQIAVYACFNFPDGALEDPQLLEDAYGWALSDYDRMGPS